MALTLAEAARETGPRAVHQAAYPDTAAYEAQIHGLKEIADLLRNQLDHVHQERKPPAALVQAGTWRIENWRRAAAIRRELEEAFAASEA